MQLQILQYWFGSYLEPNGKLLPSLLGKWFSPTVDIDNEIREKFSAFLSLISSNEASRKDLQSSHMVLLFTKLL